MFLLGYENNESIRMSKHARGIAIAFSTEKNQYENTRRSGKDMQVKLN